MPSNIESTFSKNNFKQYLQPEVLRLLFLGFSAGLPILLIFSSLSLWLNEAGLEKKLITMFSWAALGYSFKFLWAPLVDQLPLPFLSKRLGQRRSCLLLSQLGIIAAIILMACTDPTNGTDALKVMAYAAVLLGFSSATQDITIDAYRIESANDDIQALLASTYIVGYRIGMIAAGAGALYLAAYFGSTKETYIYSAWRNSYFIMAALMLIGVATTLVIPRPKRRKPSENHYTNMEHLRYFLLFVIGFIVFITAYRYLNQPIGELKTVLSELISNNRLTGFITKTSRLLSALITMLVAMIALSKIGFSKYELLEDGIIFPVKDFFNRYGLSLALLLLSLIGLYRISDIVLGVISNLFYQDLGFSKNQIATAVKTYGLIMTLFGGVWGGMLALKYGVLRILLLGAALSALTNLLFIALSNKPSIGMLYFVVSADNLSAGLASAAFIAFLSSLTNIKFTATQYALFSSIMTFFPKILGGYSGTIVEATSYETFFTITALLGLPVILLILFAGKKLFAHNQLAR